MSKRLYFINALNFTVGFLFLSVLNSSVQSELISSFAYRVFSATLSLTVVLTLLKKKEFLVLLRRNNLKFYFFFVFLYLIHIFHDTFYVDIYKTVFQGSPIVFFLMTFSYLLITPMALLSVHKLDVKQLTKVVYILFSLIFVLNLILNKSLTSIDSSIIRESTFSNVGVIDSSIFAAVLFLWSILKLFDKYANGISKLLYCCIALITLVDISRASTKSSSIAIAVILILFFFNNINKFKTRKNLIVLVSIAVFISLTYTFWYERLNILYQRFDILSKNGDQARNEIWSLAINKFTTSPYLGSSFVIPGKAFFHDFFLDAFVTTGVLGGLIFTFISFKGWSISLKWLNLENDKLLFSISFMTLFLSGLFSSNLFTDYLFWGYLFIILSWVPQKKNNKIFKKF